MKTKINLFIQALLLLFLWGTGYAQITKEFQIKVSDSGLYFDGEQRKSNLHIDNSGFEFYFGRRITPHGDCIKKYGDFLFLSWYLGGEENKNVMLSRLHIPTQTLETIKFPHTHVGFRHTYEHIGDSHNTIAVAVCPIDSTVHLLYDMHSYSQNDFPETFFNYQVSLKGAANAPVGEFTIDLFKPRQNYLNQAYNYSDITYPNFFLNNNDELFVWFREGGNNNGMYKFAKYDGNEWGPFTNFNTLNARTKGSAYNWGLYGDLKYINGKLRVGFLKRMSYNNDKYVYNNGFHYAYTDDPEGQDQWYNYKAEPFSLPLIKPEKIFFYEPADLVTQGGANSITISSGTDFTVTDAEAVHFITNNVRSSVDGSRRNVHAYKRSGDTTFTINTNFPGGNLYAVDGNQVYLISKSNDRVVIYRAEGGTNNWEKLYTATSGIAIEHYNALIADGKLFVYAMQKASGDARPIYIQMYDLNLVPVDINNAISFISPSSGQEFDYDVPVKVEAAAGDSITSLTLMVDSVVLRTINDGEFIWGMDSIVDSELFKLSSGRHSLKLIGVNVNDSIIEKNTYIEVKEPPVPQSPYDNVATSVPGKIEAENFDLGSIGLAYSDKDESNDSGLYREEGVDIVANGTGFCVDHNWNNEWQEYTINVEEDGVYDFVISYSSGINVGSPRITLSLPESNNEIVSNYKLFYIVDWNSFFEETVAYNVSLTKGEHILRVETVQQGFFLDWIEVRGEATGINNLNKVKLSVYPNPSSVGVFTLSEARSYNVFSIDGMMIKSGEGTTVNLSSYAKGMYLLKTQGEVHKIVFE